MQPLWPHVPAFITGRLLRGGAGPDLNHIVYVVGTESEDFGSANEELMCFLAFVEALGRAGMGAFSLLPEAVVVTRGVHACVESDKVTE